MQIIHANFKHNMISNYLSLVQNRHPFLCRGLIRYGGSLIQNLNSTHLPCRNFTSLSKRLAVRHAEDCRVLYSMLEKSGVKNVNQLKRFIGTSSKLNNSENENDNNKKKEKENKDFRALLISFLVGVTLLDLYLRSEASNYSRGGGNHEFADMWYISWNDFIHQMLSKGEVEEIIVTPDIDIVAVVLYDGAIVKNKRLRRKYFHMKVANIHKFEEKVRNAEASLGIRPGQGVTITYDRHSEAMSKLFVLTCMVILGLWIFRSKTFKKSIKFDMFNQLRRAKFTLVDPLTGPGKGVRFSDVAGLQEPKQEVMEFVDYLKRPDHYKSLGAKVPRGALLLGPPGCGKTLLAKAVATEANVPFLSMNGTEFIEMIGGLGAARVRDLFREARKRSPCIIYIDEIDAIGKKRSATSGYSESSGENEQTLNQLLVEMDGMSSKEGVILLASTNRSEVLDKALLRPGRFDRHILIDLPNLKERKEIFETHLKSIRLENKPEHFSKRMASLTPGFSGADIANVCNEAALHAARHKKDEVKGSDLEYAVERVVGGTEKRSSAISPGEKKIIAFHETGHALVGWLLEHTDALLKVTIVPRTNLALGFAQYTPADQHLFSKEELFDKMCMALGGRVAESLTFNRVTTGAQNDLQKVTRMAYAQIRQFGMNETVGLISFSENEARSYEIKPYSKKLQALIDEEARRLVTEAYLKTEEILRNNQDKLKIVAEELLKKETLSYDDVEKLIGPPLHGKKKLIDPIEYELSVNQAAGPEPPPPEEKSRQEVKKTQPSEDECSSFRHFTTPMNA